MDSEEKRPPKKPYDKPTATKLTREQAKLKLIGSAMMGNREATELLVFLFQQDKEQTEKQPYEKPTVTALTREQARMKLMGEAMMGSRTAKELLEILFKEDQNNENTENKKSA
jgi:hypothetical protein